MRVEVCRTLCVCTGLRFQNFYSRGASCASESGPHACLNWRARYKPALPLDSPTDVGCLPFLRSAAAYPCPDHGGYILCRTYFAVAQIFYRKENKAVGHTRLGSLPKTVKWSALVERVAGTQLSSFGEVSTAAIHVRAIAAQTLDATRKALSTAANDVGVRYTVYLLTQVVLASRTADWKSALAEHGIQLSDDSTVFDLTVEVQNAIDRYVVTRSGATDASEMAQQSAGEALLSLANEHDVSLFGDRASDTRKAVRPFSTRRGFGKLGQRFFGRFVARFLDFYLSRVTAAKIGSPRLRDIGEVAQFHQALRTHRGGSALIVREFCGDWYSKTHYEKGIQLGESSRFLAIAVRKLRSELARQGSES